MLPLQLDLQTRVETAATTAQGAAECVCRQVLGLRVQRYQVVGGDPPRHGAAEEPLRKDVDAATARQLNRQRVTLLRGVARRERQRGAGVQGEADEAVVKAHIAGPWLLADQAVVGAGQRIDTGLVEVEAAAQVQRRARFKQRWHQLAGAPLDFKLQTAGAGV